ncbi:FeoC-like transcriptional regulator [Methanomethylovorans sp.]|uniref:FeoC-like transcriptional regulator n=1 Tax=Methanomethylovorans sp. TaxID=2758717 RepID=UPI00351C67B8
MIVDILRYIFVERLSLNEAALLMGMSGEQLKDRLRIMEQMGYLRKTEADVSHGCGSCSSCTVCPTGDMSSEQYMLTDKGSRLIEKE